jgi:putative membrane protein
VLPLAVLAAGYALALRRNALRPTAERHTVARRTMVYFAIGWLLLALAVLSPLHALGASYLLTAHMVQHMLLTVVAPPLLLLGVPGWMIAPVFRRGWQRRVGRWLTYPVLAFGLYNANIWVWHLPALLDAESPPAIGFVLHLLDTALVVGTLAVLALWLPPRLLNRPAPSTGSAARTFSALATVAALGVVMALAIAGPLNAATWSPLFQPHEPLHLLMDALFLVTALLYWMPILSPIPALLPRLSLGAGMLYMFVSTQPMMALGALLTFAPQPLYSRYAAAPLLLGFTRLGDQQMAGLIMWLPMDVPLLIAVSILLFRWIGQHDLAERIAAGELGDIEQEAPFDAARAPEEPEEGRGPPARQLQEA